jgi:glycosyltransferase involved in cell wall biosynthesis
MVKISVTMLTKNSQKYITEVLESLKVFDEVVILDNGSTDETITIAQKYQNVKVYQNEFIGFGPLKNMAIDYASNDWILSIDSDEIMSQNLIDEILKCELKKDTIYSIKRDNCYNKKVIKCCGWENDVVKRLFNRKATRFNTNYVHESIIDNGLKHYTFSNTMLHYSFDSITSLIDKMQHYSTLYAKDHKGKKSSSPLKAFIRGSFAFFKYYILKRGFLNGYEGLAISISNANGVFYKYMKLYEENKK